MNRPIYYRVFFAIILLYSVVLTICGQSATNNEKKCGIMGMNAHLTFPCSINHIDELCKSMAEAGVSMVRLDLYWSPKNMYYQRKDFDNAAYYVTKYGMDIELNMPQIPIELDENTLVKWGEAISYYAKRYDGNTDIDIGNGMSPQKIHIRYFEIMNEPEHWQNSGLTVEMFYKFVKLSAESIREVRPKGDALIVFPGISNQCDFNKKILEYHDEKCKGIKDYIDILNFHYYSADERKSKSDLSNWVSFLHKQTDIKDKPIWMTEYGHSLWDQTEDRQSELLPKQALIAASLGVEKIFYYQYHQFGGNYFSKRQKEDFFGIIDTSIKNSYGSFLRNDGVYKTAISDGDGTRKIYITPRRGNKFSLYTITDSMCRELNTNGIVIGGRGFTIDSVILEKGNGVNAVLFNGGFVIPRKKKTKLLKLEAEKFKNVDKSDKLIVKIKDVANQSNQWNGVQPLKSYYAYKTLAEEIHNANIAHCINNPDGINIIEWKVEFNYRYAIWLDNDKECFVYVKNGMINRALNMWGGEMSYKGNKIRVNKDVVYLESNSKLEFANTY